ncbi:MAG: sigma-70 family RNA polymerase sigma factor [Undibacterium sp.]|nr:sigma-70 family RNA polymerase sigma factor [Opitutaceae bacterium]
MLAATADLGHATHRSNPLVRRRSATARALATRLPRPLASRDDVNDGVQDTYIKLLRFKPSGLIRSPKAFLFTIARNVALDLRRRRAVSSAQPITETAALAVLEDSPGVVDLVSRRQELALLAEAIRTLPERCQHVFLLRKIQGLSQRDIAARLGITEKDRRDPRRQRRATLRRLRA